MHIEGSVVDSGDTDASGQVTFKNIPAGPYTISHTDPCLTNPRPSATVEAGKTTTTELHVRSLHIKTIKVVRITFRTDHASVTPASAMKNNNSDWQDTGSAFTKPEWESGKQSKPVSQTKNSPVTLDVDFEVEPKDACSTSCKITGTAGFGTLVFKASGNIAGGVQTFSATSGALPDEVSKLTGDISWSVETGNAGTFDAGSSSGHIIYVTIDTPISVGGREAGITQKRMEMAIKLVNDTGKATAPWTVPPPGLSRPHQIVASLMVTLGNYTLNRDLTVPAALGHPGYLISWAGGSVVGGAWNIADFMTKKAECQAIVRFVRAVIKQVGCPGNAQIMVVFADPGVNNGNTVLEEDWEHPPDPSGNVALHHAAPKTIGGKRCFASLVDVFPGDTPGNVFDGHARGRLPGIGANAFEACLKFSDSGTSKYYPGGTGGGSMDNKEAVIFVFQALVFLSEPGGGQPSEWLVKVEEIVKRYRDRNGHVIP